jgi:CHAD domain-containing protein
MDPHDLVRPEPWLAQLAGFIERVRSTSGADSDSVHDMRVAAGRLSVWLEIGGRTALHDDLRWLRRSAARLRDVDVMLERERPQSWTELLQEQRAEELAHVRATLGSNRARALIQALGFTPSPQADRARRGARNLVHRVLRAGERMSHDEQDPHALHRLRRRLRRLRYALEWLNEESRDVKKVQDALGAFNDGVVELRHLDSHPELRLPDSVLEDLREEHEIARLSSLDAWKKHRSGIRDLARTGGALEG